MSSSASLKRSGIALAASLAFAAVPVAAQAAPVNLATSGPFVVLGGSTVTNTGPSVLNGDLGVAPGTALVGFGLPAVVNGATHANDAVARQAQADLTTAYDVAAGQAVTRDLTGTDLGGQALPAGAYRYASSAQLTGTVTLDAQGDPNAQFVFMIGSTLTTASASSVVLINGASPCNVFWQVGSSATIGTTTAFQGNVLALTSISVNTGASVIGRTLARNGAVTLDTNVLSNSQCAAGTTSPIPPADTTPTNPTPTPPTDTTPVPPAPTPPAETSPSGPTPTPPTETSPSGPAPTAPAGTGPAPASPAPVAAITSSRPGSTSPAPAGEATSISTVARKGKTVMRRAPFASCTAGFRATVRGRGIKQVVFSLDGKRIASRARSPFKVYVRAAPGRHKVTARVTFKDATRPRVLTLGYRPCAAAVLRPRRGPSRFAG